MRFLSHLFLLVCLYPSALYPQATQNRPGADQESKPPSSGVVNQVPMTVTPAFWPLNLKQLVDASDVIIKGEVEAILGSRKQGISAQTDLQISVSQFFKGDKDKLKDRKVIISQDGGRVGNEEFICENDPMMQLGEEYYFFLKADEQKDVPDFGFPRYYIRGIWAGRIRVEDKKIKVKPSQYLARDFHEMSSDDFEYEILTLK